MMIEYLLFNHAIKKSILVCIKKPSCYKKDTMHLLFDMYHLIDKANRNVNPLRTCTRYLPLKNYQTQYPCITS